MRRNSSDSLYLTVFLCFFFLVSCGDGKEGPQGPPGPPGDFSGNEGPSGDFFDGNGPASGSLALQPTVDMSGAFGLMSMDNESGASLTLAKEHNRKVKELGLIDAPTFEIPEKREGVALVAIKDDITLNGEPFYFFSDRDGFSLATTSDDDSELLKKIDSNGDVSSAISTDCQSASDSSDEESEGGEESHDFDQQCQSMPPISTIAQAPTGEIYFHFRYPFIYRIPESPNEDPWDQKNGYQCQVFKVKGGTIDQLIAAPPTENNMECIDNTHFIDTWRANANGVFQFDSGGNIYYPGSIPDSSKMVVYKRTRDGGSTTEVINANICVQDYLITPTGGTFYTGNTCSDGNMGGGDGGFFRYVAPGVGGQVIEIARDWWNFIYDTRVDSSTGTPTDKAVFFGPDPRSSSTASWDSACIFEFDPTGADVSSRISEVITCGSDIWSWLELRRTEDVADYGEGYHDYSGTEPNVSLSWKTEYKRRCESKDEVFAGGGSQIKAIKQNTGGDIFVIGNVRKKVEGTLKCDVDLRGPHCIINDSPDLGYTTQSTCSAQNGTWVDQGNCSDGTTDSDCLDHEREWVIGQCDTWVAQGSCVEVANKVVWADNRCVIYDKAECISKGGNWDWPNGTCSNSTYNDDYENCIANGGTYDIEGRGEEWKGNCRSTATPAAHDSAASYHDYHRCTPNFYTENVNYRNVTGDICVTADTGDRSTWWDWNNSDFRFTSRSALTSAGVKFISHNMSCSSTSGSTGGGNEWTNEYQAMAKVVTDKKTLALLSLPSEKAIDLWVVNNVVYYSSYDATQGKYLLNKVVTENTCVDSSKTTEAACNSASLTWVDRRCVDSSLTTKTACEGAYKFWSQHTPKVILNNFETYNLAKTASSFELYADGLDFSDNSYKFGKINVSTSSFTANTGMTGRVNNIIILNQ